MKMQITIVWFCRKVLLLRSGWLLLSLHSVSATKDGGARSLGAWMKRSAVETSDSAVPLGGEVNDLVNTMTVGMQ